MQTAHNTAKPTSRHSQWLFGLCTAAALICLGLWLEALGNSGLALMVVGTAVGALNTYTFFRTGKTGRMTRRLTPRLTRRLTHCMTNPTETQTAAIPINDQR